MAAVKEDDPTMAETRELTLGANEANWWLVMHVRVAYGTAQTPLLSRINLVLV